MASLRNAIPQRPYRERSQPGSRAKLGILEKHKDYSARARDYNAKKARLRILRQKATDRNPDEFHFGMMSSRTMNGVKVADRGTKALSQAVVKLMKTQDAGYLRTVRERVRRQREKVEESLQVVEDEEEGQRIETSGKRKGRSERQHTVFVDDAEEQRDFDPEQWFDTDIEGLDKVYNRPRRRSEQENTNEKPVDMDEEQPKQQRGRRQREAEELALKQDLRDRRKVKHSQQHRKAQVDALRTQERELLIAEQELDRQRAQMNHTIGGTNKNGVKFKVKERKR